MKTQQFVPQQPILEEQQHAADISDLSLVVVHSGYDRRADDHFRTAPDQSVKILPHSLITDTGHLAVKHPIKDFEIAHPLVYQRKQLFHTFPFDLQIALDSRRNPRFPAQGKKLSHEFRLQQRLTA